MKIFFNTQIIKNIYIGNIPIGMGIFGGTISQPQYTTQPTTPTTLPTPPPTPTTTLPPPPPTPTTTLPPTAPPPIDCVNNEDCCFCIYLGGEDDAGNRYQGGICPDPNAQDGGCPATITIEGSTKYLDLHGGICCGGSCYPIGLYYCIDTDTDTIIKGPILMDADGCGYLNVGVVCCNGELVPDYDPLNPCIEPTATPP